MTSFKTLKFKSLKRNRRESEIIARRHKLIVKLEEQQDAACATHSLSTD